MSEKKTPLVELRNMDVTFYKSTGLKKRQPIKVLSDISLKIGSGEVLAMVGESGGGKTTIGNVIAGLVKPSGGEVLFEGVPLNKMTKEQFRNYRKNVQMVQQDSYAALNPARTIYQSLAAPILKSKSVKNKRELFDRIKQLLEFVELKPFTQFINKYPHQLSGGQRQRILLARAISLSPKLIIADEPVSMVDVSLRISILNLMSKLNKELGISFLYITHDLATARYIGREGSIGVLYLGELVELGSVTKVLEDPKHPYLQALLTAVPVPDPDLSKVRKKLQLKDVEMPSIINPPTGCRFHTRCIYADDSCAKATPKLAHVDGRYIACHKSLEIPKFSLVDDLRDAQDRRDEQVRAEDLEKEKVLNK